MKTTLLVVIGGFIIWSCNNTPKTPTQETQHAQHHHEPIELNNGTKWEVNLEMKAPLTAGEELVNAYIESNQNDSKTLAQQLKEQNDKLIKSCTMDGKSHDELHKWLHPHLELVKELANATDESTSKEIVLKLQSSYQVFHQYFD